MRLKFHRFCDRKENFYGESIFDVLEDFWFFLGYDFPVILLYTFNEIEENNALSLFLDTGLLR